MQSKPIDDDPGRVFKPYDQRVQQNQIAMCILQEIIQEGGLLLNFEPQLRQSHARPFERSLRQTRILVG